MYILTLRVSFCIFAIEMTENERSFLYQLIGNNIKKAREHANLSQKELSEALKKSRATIVNIEKGRHQPGIHMLLEITNILDINLSQLISSEMWEKYSQNELSTSIQDKLNINLSHKNLDKINSFIKTVSKQKKK